MSQKYILKLYVMGESPGSAKLIEDLKRNLEEDFKGVYSLHVIDVAKNPELAEQDKILATPTLMKELPLPVRKIIGDLSEKHKVFLGLDLQSR